MLDHPLAIVLTGLAVLGTQTGIVLMLVGRYKTYQVRKTGMWITIASGLLFAAMYVYFGQQL